MTPDERTGAGRGAFGMLMALLALLYLVFIVRTGFSIGGERYFVLFDDAMISMQFARNLAQGSGLVLNAGEVPVEGYSNLLWTLLLSLFHGLPLPPRMTSFWVSCLGALLLLANVALTRSLALRVFKGPDAPFAATLAAASVGLCYALVYWSLRGFEVGLLALFTQALLLCALRFEAEPRPSLGLLVLLLSTGLVLSRSDALALAALAGIYLLTSPARAARKLGLGAMLILSAALLLHTAFRLEYYGYPLPNTYYLKMTGAAPQARFERGALMLVLLVLRSLHLPLFGCLALFLCRKEAVRDRKVRLLAAGVSLQLAYSVYVGGDAWERFGFANRFIAVVLPLLLILGSAGWVALARGLMGGEERGALRAFRLTLGLLAAFAGCAAYAVLVSNRRLPFQLDARPARIALSAFGYAAALGLLVARGPLSRGAVRGARALLSRLSAARWSDTKRVALALVVACTIQGGEWVKWLFFGAELTQDDANATRIALELRANTPPGTSLGLCRLGAITYFSERRVIDLLGKNDSKVAHGPSRLDRFVPGHDKWDLQRSIGELKPDLVVDLPVGITPAELAYLAHLGYTRDAVTGFYRKSS